MVVVKASDIIARLRQERQGKPKKIMEEDLTASAVRRRQTEFTKEEKKSESKGQSNRVKNQREKRRKAYEISSEPIKKVEEKEKTYEKQIKEDSTEKIRQLREVATKGIREIRDKAYRAFVAQRRVGLNPNPNLNQISEQTINNLRKINYNQ